MSTKLVKALVPVLGLKRDQIAELTDTPFLQLVLKRGWLETVSKTEAKDAAKAAGGPDVQLVDPDITKTSE